MPTLRTPPRGHQCRPATTESVRPEALTLWDRGVGLVPGCKSHLQVKSLRYLLPLQVAALRRVVLAHEPRVLGAFDVEMGVALGELTDRPGDLAARLRRAGLEDGEQGMALAEFHAAPTEENERMLLRETLEEIGALQLLAAELRARIAAREGAS
jgi:hypothetical protein